MKNVKLLEVTLDELGGEHPAAGSDVTIRGIRYRAMEIQPPSTVAGATEVAVACSGGSGRRVNIPAIRSA